jgi:hypothetical protein
MRPLTFSNRELRVVECQALHAVDDENYDAGDVDRADDHPAPATEQHKKVGQRSVLEAFNTSAPKRARADVFRE